MPKFTVNYTATMVEKVAVTMVVEAESLEAAKRGEWVDSDDCETKTLETVEVFKDNIEPEYIGDDE